MDNYHGLVGSPLDQFYMSRHKLNDEFSSFKINFSS